jgi:hypothetical protein
MRYINFFSLIASMLLAGCGAVQLNPITSESRAVHATADMTKVVTVPEGMLWYDSPQRTHALRFPPGRYTLEAEDNEYWYFRSPDPLEFRDFEKGQTTNTRNLRGGLMLAKHFSMLPGAGYIEGENTAKVMVWKLGQDFARLEHKGWSKNF